MNGKASVVVGACIGMGIGIGGALMYWFDPAIGKRRRAHARYKAYRIARRVRKAVDTASHDLKKISREIPEAARRIVPEKARAMLRA
jgi:hypothetical protein